MKKIYKKPTLSIQEFAVDSIMSGTGEVTTAESNLLPLITDLPDGTGNIINLDDGNKLQSINYEDFFL